MINNQTSIIALARNTMAQIEWKYNSSVEVSAIFKSESEQIKNLLSVFHAGFFPKDRNVEEIKKQIKPYWVVFFDFEDEAGIEKNVMIMQLDDETGEPFEIRHKQARFKILKTVEGKYYTERF